MSEMRRCYSCMEKTGEDGTCPACGWQEGSGEDNPLYLPAGYLLRERYFVGRVLGVGGFGIVYLAWDSNLDVRVAVKEFLPKEYAARGGDRATVIPYSGSAGEEFTIGIDKFLDEAKALARFHEHPGVVRVHESFRANNTAYMIMQYLDGLTLKEYLKKQTGERIPYQTAVMALTPIMDALREVHAAGFVHRDISPDNIFITRQKQIKLLDFGAARYAIGEHSKSLTSVLKHGYAPVEQYSSKGNQGPWSDVYAVSATIYRCITGTVPPDSMERMQGDTIRPPSQLNVEIPLTCEVALMKGMALKASQRFTDIEQLQKGLLTGMASAPQATAQPATTAPLETVKQKAERRGTVQGLATRTEPVPATRDYGSDEPNYRLMAVKIAAGLFVILAAASYFLKKEPEQPAKPAVATVSATQEPVPAARAIEPATSQRTLDVRPVAAASSGFDSEDWKFLGADSEKEIYVNPATQKQIPDGSKEVVISTKHLGANRQEIHLLRINCQQQKYEIRAWEEYKDDLLVSSGKSSEPPITPFQPNTQLHAVYQAICR